MIVYSTKNCPQCKNIKNILDNKGIKFTEKEVFDIEKFMDTYPTARSFPFATTLDGTAIGGGPQILEYIKGV